MVAARGPGLSCAERKAPAPPEGHHALAGAVATRAWKSAKVGAPLTPEGEGTETKKLEGSEMKFTQAVTVLAIGSFPFHFFGAREPSSRNPGRGFPSLPQAVGHSPW